MSSSSIFMQTRIKRGTFEYLARKLEAENIYKLNQQSLLITEKLLKTMDRVNTRLKLEYPFDDPVKFLGVVELIMSNTTLEQIIESLRRKT